MAAIDFNTAARPAAPYLPKPPANDRENEAPRAAGPAPVFDAPRQSKFFVEDFDTLTPLAQGWRVKGLWPATGLCFVAGASMSGKSFWVLDNLAKVCQGRPVLGRKSKPSGVLYVASEGPNGVRVRVAGLRQRSGPLGGSFAFIGQAPDLTDEEDVADLRETISDAKARMAESGHDLGLVVIDTLSASIPGADENSAKDMSPVLAALQALAQELAVLVVVIAHTGKNEDRGMRGWSGLLANADGVIMLDGADEDGLRTGKVVKVKDGESGDRFAFRLQQVEIGRDEDGDPITTCVVEEAALPDCHAPSKPLTGEALILARALDDLIERGVTEPAPKISDAARGLRAVRLSDLKARAGEMGLWDQEDTDANRRQKWHRAKHKIMDRGMVRIEGDWVILQGR